MTRDEIMALPDDQFRALYSACMSRIGRKERTPRSDSLPALLAELDVGESLLTPKRRPPDQRSYDYARRRLGDPSANWSYRILNKGCRITRVR